MLLGSIGSHLDITSDRSGHQASKRQPERQMQKGESAIQTRSGKGYTGRHTGESTGHYCSPERKITTWLQQLFSFWGRLLHRSWSALPLTGRSVWRSRARPWAIGVSRLLLVFSLGRN